MFAACDRDRAQPARLCRIRHARSLVSAARRRASLASFRLRIAPCRQELHAGWLFLGSLTPITFLRGYVAASPTKSSKSPSAGPMSRIFRPSPDGRTRSDATINRYLDVLRAVLRIAHEPHDDHGRKIVMAPMPEVPNLSELKHVPRPIAGKDIEKLIAAAPRATSRFRYHAPLSADR